MPFVLLFVDDLFLLLPLIIIVHDSFLFDCALFLAPAPHLLMRQYLILVTFVIEQLSLLEYLLVRIQGIGWHFYFFLLIILYSCLLLSGHQLSKLIIIFDLLFVRLFYQIR